MLGEPAVQRGVPLLRQREAVVVVVVAAEEVRQPPRSLAPRLQASAVEVEVAEVAGEQPLQPLALPAPFRVALLRKLLGRDHAGRLACSLTTSLHLSSQFL